MPDIVLSLTDRQFRILTVLCDLGINSRRVEIPPTVEGEEPTYQIVKSTEQQLVVSILRDYVQNKRAAIDKEIRETVLTDAEVKTIALSRDERARIY